MKIISHQLPMLKSAMFQRFVLVTETLQRPIRNT